MKPLTIFTWGYYGWGNWTQQLLRAVDAVEESRGFKPPVFVDIRISRAVRAKGFNGNAFGKLLGESRYRWMNSLGNRSILTHTGGIEIAEPAAVNDLLDLAVKSKAEGRRILFYCSCQWPKCDGKVACHRTTVARLLLKAARKRQIPVEVVEWPGGDPSHPELDVSPEVFSAVSKGRFTIPLAKQTKLPEIGGLAWGSIATLHSEDQSFHRVVGPAGCRQNQWVLPILSYFHDPDTGIGEYEKESKKLRRAWGLEPQFS